MNITFDLLKKIYESVGIENLEIIAYNNNSLMLRFDYWMRVDISKIESVLPDYISVTEEDDYDEDCGYLFCYIIKNKQYNG